MKKLSTLVISAAIALGSSIAITTNAQAFNFGNMDWNDGPSWGNSWNSGPRWGNNYGPRYGGGPNWGGGPRWGGNNWNGGPRWNSGPGWGGNNWGGGPNMSMPRMGWGSKSGPRWGNNYGSRWNGPRNYGPPPYGYGRPGGQGQFNAPPPQGANPSTPPPAAPAQ